MKKELLKGLTEEQIKKVEACKNAEEILALAKAEGVELNEEQLAAVSGGCSGTRKCPECGSENVKVISNNYNGNPLGKVYKCRDCKVEFVS